MPLLDLSTLLQSNEIAEHLECHVELLMFHKASEP